MRADVGTTAPDPSAKGTARENGSMGKRENGNRLPREAQSGVSGPGEVKVMRADVGTAAPDPCVTVNLTLPFMSVLQMFL